MFKDRILSMVIAMGLLISQAVPPALAATQCDSALFISDLTVPDGSSFAPGAAFAKTWRLQNNGTCTWDTTYNLVWAGGDAMGGTSVRIPVSVPPGQMLDLSINLTAPTTTGHFKSLWKLSNTSGVQFGIGDSAAGPFWVDIHVINTSAIVFDFVASASHAQWKSGAGALPYPGASGDSRGYSAQVDSPHLEDDSFDSASGLLTVPQNKFNGYIQATYPEFQVQSGDSLQTLVNCEFGATNCYVTFRIYYLLPNGVQRTLWTFKEAYDKRFYRASLDLTPLAGQKVRFVFMLLSSGLAGGDRAVWGAPRIVRTGTSQPPAPPPTLTPLPPLTPTATPIVPAPTIQAGGCDRAAFVADVTVQDGTTFAPGAVFTKTWRLKNTGACVWTTAYKLIYYSGEQMSAPTQVNLPWGAASGSTVDISVNMVAPSAPGSYRGFWMLVNAGGQYFGIGANASNPVWVEINVAGDAGTNTTYDFMANVCSAQWKSGAGVLPCPGTNGDSKGFVFPLSPVELEDGSVGPAGLLTFPQNRYNGYIQGVYPAFTVQPGDRFQSNVGCEHGANCYVTFRLDYMTASGYVATFWQRREQNDGRYYAADVDLTPLAGRSVRFILTTLATGYATNDRAAWSGPRIARTRAAPPTITPLPPQWLTYTNQQYGFQFSYPPQAQVVSQTAGSVKMILPFTPGTNLADKYLQMSVNENVNPCQSPLSHTSPPGSPTETVVINGIPFFKQVGGDAGMSQRREWVAWSTLRGNACISMDFVLHWIDPGAFSTPPPVFDKAAESAVFMQIMNTFAFLAAATPTNTAVPPALSPLPPTLTPVPGTPVASPSIRSLHMIDSVNGWALSDQHVLRTSDGGTTWYNVLSENRPTGGYFASPARAWVISDFADISVGSLYRTTNGGVNWTKFDVPFNGGILQFLDDNNGFVLYGEPSGMQKHAVALYQTTDGGATWTLKYDNNPTIPSPGTSLPFSGHKMGMGFRDPTTGWVGGDYPNNGVVYLYKTTDSGMTWTPVALALPAGYQSAFITTRAPKFFGPNDAVLPVWMTLGAGMSDLFLYTTHDGGATWQAPPAFARNAQHTDIITLSNTISWDWASLFHVTGNGGNSWTTITPNVSFGEDFRELDFVSPTTGWARLQLPDGRPALYRTTDGGATWTGLYGHTSPTPPPDPSAFARSLVEALNARNFDALPAMMDTSFTFGYWESQGTTYTAAQAIDSLRTGLTVTLIPDAGKDLNTLLGGLNPYEIMGLDPARSYGLFVSGWGSDSSAEAILYVTRRVDGSLYWHSVLIAPTRFIHATPTPSDTPTALIGPYAVVGVALNGVLNIHSGAGVANAVVGSFPADATGVMRTGATASADNATWVEVQNPGGGTGWVDSSYLTEYVSREDFCADGRLLTLIDQLKASMLQSDGDLFASTVGPAQDVAINIWRGVPPVRYTRVTARSIFTDTTIYEWGTPPGEGGPSIYGTFSEIVQPQLVDVFNSAYQLGCDHPSHAAGVSADPWPFTNIHYYSITKPPTANVFDWKVWLVGFEYVDGIPYLYNTVEYIYDP